MSSISKASSAFNLSPYLVAMYAGLDLIGEPINAIKQCFHLPLEPINDPHARKLHLQEIARRCGFPLTFFSLPEDVFTTIVACLGERSVVYKRVCRQFKTLLDKDATWQPLASIRGGTGATQLASKHSWKDLALRLSGITSIRSFMDPANPLKVTSYANLDNATRFALQGESLFVSQVGANRRYQIVRATTTEPQKPQETYTLDRDSFVIEQIAASTEVLACSTCNLANPNTMRIPIWRRHQPNQILRMIEPRGHVLDVKIHGDKLFACKMDQGAERSSEIEMYDLETGAILPKQRNAPQDWLLTTRQLKFDGAHTLFTRHTYFDPNLRNLTAQLHQWDLRTLQKPVKTMADPSMVSGTMHVTEGRLYTSHQIQGNAVVKHWNLSSWKPVKEVKVNGDKMILKIGSMAGYVYTSSQTGVVRIWDLALNLKNKRDLSPQQVPGYRPELGFHTEILGGTKDCFFFGCAFGDYPLRRLNLIPRTIKLWSYALPPLLGAADSSDFKAKS